jgi:tetratricopeptide (TPR) repeat protein
MSDPSAVEAVIHDLFGLLDDEEEDEAFHAFFGDFAGHEQKHDEMILYEEWLLFDWRDADSKSLLARGIDERSFTRDQRERCRQLLNNIYSYWQVVDVLPGYSLTLEDVYTGMQYKVRHSRYSNELPIDSIFCARLALVNDRWTPASGFIEPQVLHFTQDNRDNFFGARPEELSSRTLLWERRRRTEKPLCASNTIPVLSLEDARQLVQKALDAANLSRFASVETVEQWIRLDNGRTKKQIEQSPYPLALSLVLGLSIGVRESVVEALTVAIASLQHAVYQQDFPENIHRGNRSNERFVGTFDPDEWLDAFDEAYAQMHTSDGNTAVEWFEQAFEMMHKSRSTNPLVFRQLHNAALAYFYSGEELLGRKTLDAALALNPGYDLGRQTKAALDAGELDTTLQLSTIVRQAQRAALAGRKRQPLHRYSGRRTSPIIRYYEWIKDLGINFYDDSHTDQLFALGSGAKIETAVNYPETPKKPGRNDPCPCGKKRPDGSPVKYKHCHGA